MRGCVTIPARPARWGMTGLLLGGVWLAVWATPRASDKRADEDLRVFRGETSGEAALRMRPLDGRLHGLIARRAAHSGAWDQALHWAQLATAHRPANPDPWLVQAAAHASMGSSADSDAALRTGLSRLHAAPDDALVEFVLRMARTPQRLAQLMPEGPSTAGAAPVWRLLAVALQRRAPAYADAIAARRIETAPDDPQALKLRVAIAMANERPSLALHHARMLRALEARRARAHVVVSEALHSFDPPRLERARNELTDALGTVVFASRAERGRVEEELVRTLVALGDADSLSDARTLGTLLLTRPATRAVQLRRERTVAALQSASKGARR